jgi:hypothetical protein
MYLIDTNVISELREPRSRPVDPRVRRWAAGVSAASQFMSVVTVMELELGILKLARRDPAQAAVLRAWMDTRVLPLFAPRILPVDTGIAMRCAPLHVPTRISELDAFIAATALTHNLTVVTRNTADFTGTGVRTLNPWQS